MRNRVSETLLNSTPHNIKIVFTLYYNDEHLIEWIRTIPNTLRRFWRRRRIGYRSTID
jgi:hypothetical protein